MAVDLLADDAPAPANPPAKPVSAPVDLLADDGGTDLLSDVGGAPAKPKTEGWADWAKRLYTEHEEPMEKLQQAAAGRVLGLGAGAGQAATSAGSAVADYVGAPGMAKYLSDMEQKFTKGAEAAKEISYPKGLTKKEAEWGQSIGDIGAMALLAEAAPGVIGSYAMRIPGVGPAVEAFERAHEDPHEPRRTRKGSITLFSATCFFSQFVEERLSNLLYVTLLSKLFKNMG